MELPKSFENKELRSINFCVTPLCNLAIKIQVYIVDIKIFFADES